MMAHAIDNPAPTTMVLISGDRDFIYTVSILSLRRYRVVLLAPCAVYTGIKAQVNAVYRWPDDFLPKPPPPAPQCHVSEVNTSGSSRPQGPATASLIAFHGRQSSGSTSHPLSAADGNATIEALLNGGTAGSQGDDCVRSGIPIIELIGSVNADGSAVLAQLEKSDRMYEGVTDRNVDPQIAIAVSPFENLPDKL